MDRAPRFSVRLKLTLSYAGFLMLAGLMLLAAVWVFLLRGVPASRLVPKLSNFPLALDPHNFGPAAFGSAAVIVLAFLLVFGLVGGWFLAGRMLAPLDRITDATHRHDWIAGPPRPATWPERRVSRARRRLRCHARPARGTRR